jgi:pilus assembly protein CpaB
MGRRTALLIVAVIVALLGVALVLLYVRGIDNRAREGQETVSVLYTKAPIALGTTGAAAESAGAFELREIPRDAAATGALSSTEPISSLFSLAALPSGVPVISSQWGEVGTSNALPIPGNKLGVSVQLGDPQRVAGFVQPGSQVAVFLTSERNGQPNTSVLLPRVTVLAVGPTAVTTTSTATNGTTNTEQVPNAILTLALDQKQSEQIILGQTSGELYFGLLTKDSQTRKSAGTSAQNLFS